MSRWYVRSADRRPDPPPLHVDPRLLAWTVIGAWTVLLVAALVARDRLEQAGRGWWVWTPVVGIALGLWGYRWLTRTQPRPMDDIEHHTDTDPADDDPAETPTGRPPA